jgi:hypothetical protein
VDVLAIGDFFVEIDSYAIAILSYANSTSGNSMGLILDARGFIFLESIAYLESGDCCSGSGRKLYLFFHLKTLFRSKVRSVRSSAEGGRFVNFVR